MRRDSILPSNSANGSKAFKFVHTWTQPLKMAGGYANLATGLRPTNSGAPSTF